MTACLYYRRGNDYENEWRQQQVFKGQCLGLGCWPLFGAPAGTPLQQESKLSSASKQQALWYMWYGDSGLSAWPCCPKEHSHEAAVRPEGLSPGSGRDPLQARQPLPFPAARKAIRTKKHPCFRSKMFPNCICRQEAAARSWPAISAPLLSPGNIYCACRSTSSPPLSAAPLSKANYACLPLQHWDASRSADLWLQTLCREAARVISLLIHSLMWQPSLDLNLQSSKMAHRAI